MAKSTSSVDAAGQPVGVVVGECSVSLWGLSSFERLRRGLRAAGVGETYHWPNVPAGERPWVLVRADMAFEPGLLTSLVRTPDVALVTSDRAAVAGAHGHPNDLAGLAAALAAGQSGVGETPSRFRLANPSELASQYHGALRKRADPFLLPITADSREALERRLFAGSYKGVTDLVTKYVWPEPAYHVTKLCARMGISPNMVTTVSLLLVIAAYVAFEAGWFLLGLAAAWGMVFLDTVDGKLARVTLTSTRFGDIFDHGIDLIHPPFWYWAWLQGLATVGMMVPNPYLIIAVVVGGYVLQRIQEGVFIACFRIEMHIWRPFDSWFRLITARRNPNLILLTVATLFGRPDLGLLAVAAWTVISLAVHTVRIGQAFAARRRQALLSWLQQ